MSVATVNGVAIVSGEVCFRLAGAWDGLVVVDGDDAAKVTGALTIKIGATTLRATSVRAQADAGNLVTVRFVGGANGLGVAVGPQGYVATTRRVVIADALAVGGETLSTASAASILDEEIPRWTRARGTVGDAVRTMVGKTSAGWRILPDGTLWVGAESWATVAPEHVLESEEPTSDRFTVAIETLGVLPGSTFLGKRVTEAKYTIGASAIRCCVSYGNTRGELAEMLSTFVRREVAGSDYLATYLVRVVAQNADDSLEVVSTDGRMPPMSKVPIRPALAGVTRVLVPAGTLALLAHENGDAARPAVVGFLAGAATRVEMGSAPEPVALAMPIQDWAEDVTILLTAIRGLLAAPGPVSGLPSLPLVPSLSDDVAAVELHAT